LRRVGSRFKGLCPFHDDHNPSLELNPERQSFKCWSCGAGGDIIDFVKSYEHVDFPEALRMLADRAGIVLEKQPPDAGSSGGPSKTEILAVNAWAEKAFAAALRDSKEASEYLKERGLHSTSVDRFHLGYAPPARGWLFGLARRQQVRMKVLEEAGLASRGSDAAVPLRERFRGRLMFPIHDDRGRVVGFGGRILPGVERALAAAGRHAAKYLNTPETPVFHKRMLLYATDLARAACREAGWVAVVEGYTDVIAAHQVGVTNVVGTLGTALGEDHLRMLRRLAGRVVLVFDGDEAGMNAADRSLELFLGNELDLRVLTLPSNLDPCEFLLREGAVAFRDLAERAPDPLTYVLDRASARFDFDSIEDSRRAAEWVLGILNSAPRAHREGLDVKHAKALDSLSQRLRVPIDALERMRRRLKRPLTSATAPAVVGPGADPATARAVASSSGFVPIRAAELDRRDLELMQIVLNEPTAVGSIAPRVAVAQLRDAPLRTILQACYELHAEGESPSYENLMARLEQPAIRALVTDLVAPSALSAPEPDPLSDGVHPAPWRERLEQMLMVFDERERQARLGDLRKALESTDPHADPDAYRAIELEYRRLLTSGRKRRA
jgi:DNA primase